MNRVLVVEDDVFIGPNATFTNDIFPRSKIHKKILQTIIRKGASIGANATILPGLEIGVSAMIGAGSVVTQSVPPYAIVAGNPAIITGYVNLQHSSSNMTDMLLSSKEKVMLTQVRGVTLHRFKHVKDLRGNLSVGEFKHEVPFIPQRYFLIFDVPSKKTRGEHTHKTCHQLLICVKGRCAVVADDGTYRQEFTLDSPTLGVYLPPMIWGTQYKYSSDAILLVFASDYYDPTDYIRNYDEFITLKGPNQQQTYNQPIHPINT